MIQNNVFKIFDKIKKIPKFILSILFFISLFFANNLLAKSNAYSFYMSFTSDDFLFASSDYIYIYMFIEAFIKTLIISFLFKVILKRALYLSLSVDVKHALKCFWLFSIPFNIIMGFISLYAGKYPYIFALYLDGIGFFITTVGYILFAYYYVQYATIPKHAKTIFANGIGVYIFLCIGIIVFNYLTGGLI